MRLPAAVLLPLLACFTARGQSPDAKTPFDRHAAGRVNIHAGIGTTNGARVGMMVHAGRDMLLEGSIGYVRLGARDAPAHQAADLKSDALAVSVGIDYVTHPSNDITPLFSLLGTYTWGIDRINPFIEQRRYSVTGTAGSEIGLTSHLSLFFRVGPSLTFLSKSESGSTQFYLHFDGGIGVFL